MPPDQSGIHVPEFLLDQRQAHCLGYAVHIWTNGEQDETPEAYQRFYDSGADGVMTSRPEAIHHLDGAAGHPAPDRARPLSVAHPVLDAPRHHPAGAATATGAEGEEEVQEEEEGKKSASAAKKKHKCKKHKKKREAARGGLDISREGVAGLELAGVVARLEPVRPLL